MENSNEWTEEVNDPDFIWQEYKQDLQDQLIELSQKYPLYQEQLKKFADELNKVGNQDQEWKESDKSDQLEETTKETNHNEPIKPEQLIPQLLKNEIVISPTLIIPFCQGCYNSPKPIPTIQQTQQYLGNILPTIKQQLPNQKFNSIFLVHQDKPASWNQVREVWVDPEYKGGVFACRFCVINRLHPNYRKFYLFDNRCFYLDRGWKKMVKRFYPETFKD